MRETGRAAKQPWPLVGRQLRVPHWPKMRKDPSVNIRRHCRHESLVAKGERSERGSRVRNAGAVRERKVTRAEHVVCIHNLPRALMATTFGLLDANVKWVLSATKARVVARDLHVQVLHRPRPARSSTAPRPPSPARPARWPRPLGRRRRRPGAAPPLTSRSARTARSTSRGEEKGSGLQLLSF